MRVVKTIVAVLIAAGTLPVPAAADELADLRAAIRQATGGFKDLKATVVVTQSNRRELEKMGKVFAETYQFKKAQVLFKAPFKLRMDGDLGMVKAEFIITEAIKLIRVPKLRFKKREDITNQPDKRVIALDVGVVAESIWDLYKTVRLVRTEMDEAGNVVYVLWLQSAGSTKHQLIWVEGGTFKLLRRERFLDDGSLRVRTLYLNHKQFDGVWVPSRTEVYNGDGKIAAVTEVRDIQVNAGVGDREFE